MSSLLIQGGRVIDPANGRDGLASVLVQDRRIVAVWGTGEPAPGIPEGTSVEASGEKFPISKCGLLLL